MAAYSQSADDDGLLVIEDMVKVIHAMSADESAECLRDGRCQEASLGEIWGGVGRTLGQDVVTDFRRDTTQRIFGKFLVLQRPSITEE